ncbi:hypothetical protein GX51_01481 [Blastomyces parvus]|uniref:Uncharacterized protein n=1 Tax=Blastomyces parvus TaxID=2060905 RepID=A0A2B7XGJ5_9EURO|nr:hypothetical protein GX51_01481 [Blastomyces parvus]
MYIPDQPQNGAFPWATATSACEQRGCAISDAANLKKRKRDMGNWDSQVNANMGTCTAFIPGNAQHLEDKFRNGYSQFLKESSSGAIASKFALRPSPERRTHHSRLCWQSAAIKRRRLIQQQQNQQSQQEWNAIPRNIYTGQKQHFYTPGSDNGSPTLATPAILKSSTSSPPFLRTKSNAYNNNDDDSPSTSSISQANNKNTPHPSLSPCHICHRRPTTRSTLDAYADCDLCAERTCYICLRECMAVDCNGPRSLPNPNPGPSYGKDNNNYNNNDNNNNDGGGSKASEWRGKISPANSRPGRADEGGEEHGEKMGRKVCSWCAVESVLDGGGEIVRCFACVAGW